jgi:hypothetical protein
MLRSLALLCGAVAIVFVSAAQAADPQTPQPAPAAKGPLPTIINYPSGAAQAPAGENKNLPVIMSAQAAAGIKPPEVVARPANVPANAPNVQRAYVPPVVFGSSEIVSLPYGADFGLGGAYGYMAPSYGYGYAAPAFGSAYSFGYATPMYSPGYTVAYDFWAQPRPLRTAIVSPAGTISTMPTYNTVWQDVGFIMYR